jgi:hypothetical protein
MLLLHGLHARRSMLAWSPLLVLWPEAKQTEDKARKLTVQRPSPIQQLEEGADEEVHCMRVLIDQEREAAKEVDHTTDGMEHGLPCSGRCRWSVGVIRVKGTCIG